MVEIKHMMRLQHVNRWTLVPTTRPQTVAEHSYNVTALVREFGIRVKLPDNHIMMLTNAALVHDASEAIYGDIPSPTKAAMKQEGFDFNAVMEEEMTWLPSQLAAVLKAVDMWESMYFLSNWGTGQRASYVHGEIEARFNQKMADICSWSPNWSDKLHELFADAEDYTDE